MKTYLIITGIGALLALTMPWLVVIGLFLAIVPGVILAAMPTAFMYGVIFAMLRAVMSNAASGVTLNLLAAAATLAIFWAFPQLSLSAARAQLASLREPEVTPPKPIILMGNIFIIRPFDTSCDDICVALLKTPGVLSVRITNDGKKGVTYRLGSKDAPGELAKAKGFGLLPEEKYRADDPLSGRRALEAEWNLILGEGRSLIVSADAPIADFTLTITEGPVTKSDRKSARTSDWTLAPSPPTGKAVVVAMRDGTIMLRRSILTIFAPGAPIMIWPSGSLSNFRFGWALQRLGDGTMFNELSAANLMLKHTNVARGVDRTAINMRARATLVSALADKARSADDPAFALANQWMESFQARDMQLSEADRALLLQIIGDVRVRSADGLWAVVGKFEGDPTQLRAKAAERYLTAPDVKAAAKWINPLAQLPSGAFAEMLPDERAILADPDLSRFATGLIARQGDRGTLAIADLLRLLREHATVDPGKYGFSDATAATDAVRRAFRLIGPKAAPVRLELEKILALPRMESRYQKLDKEEWDTLLVVLGRPVDTLQKPLNSSGSTQSYQQRIAGKAGQPYDPRRD